MAVLIEYVCVYIYIYCKCVYKCVCGEVGSGQAW